MKKLYQKIKKVIQQLNQKRILKLQDKVLVFSTEQEYLIHLYVGKLEANGIQSIVLNQKDTMYQSFGLFELYVLPNDAIKAKYVIEKIDE